MHSKWRLRAWLIAAAFLLAGGAPTAYAQQGGTPAAPQKVPATTATNPLSTPTTVAKKPLGLHDKTFADAAVRGGMLEIALARQAEAKTSNPGVKHFAGRIIADHTKLDLQLKQIAQKEGFELPDTLSGAGQKKLRKFSGLTGLKFDRAYVKFAVADHRKAIAAFESEAKQGADPGLKTFASNTVPTLRQHLSMAQSLNSKFAKSKSKEHAWWQFRKKG